MNYYLYIFNDIIQEIIPEINPELPEFTIEERYSATFLKDCIIISENTFNNNNIKTGMIYNKETGEFSEPLPISQEINEIDINIEKTGNEEI